MFEIVNQCGVQVFISSSHSQFCLILIKHSHHIRAPLWCRLPQIWSKGPWPFGPRKVAVPAKLIAALKSGSAVRSSNFPINNTTSVRLWKTLSLVVVPKWHYVFQIMLPNCNIVQCLTQTPFHCSYAHVCATQKLQHHSRLLTGCKCRLWPEITGHSSLTNAKKVVTGLGVSNHHVA